MYPKHTQIAVRLPSLPQNISWFLVDAFAASTLTEKALDSREKHEHDVAKELEMAHISVPSPHHETKMMSADRENNLGIRLDSRGESSAQLLTVAEIAHTLRVPVSWVYERTRRRGWQRMPHI